MPEALILEETTHWWEVVAAVGALVGGLAAAVGAIAAWRAASANRAIGRDTADALALTLAPEVAVDAFAVAEEGPTGHVPWRLRIDNRSRFAATDVSAEANFADGLRRRDGTERLGPGEYRLVELRNIDAPPGGPRPEQAGTSLVVSYSDERGIARYQQSFAFLSRKTGTGEPSPMPTVAPLGPPERIK